MEIIKTINLTKKYKNLIAVDNLNLSINQGEIFSLLGVNGAGKTTTIKMLSCLVKATSGDILINDNNIKYNEKEIKKIISVSPQETSIAYNLTTKENLEFICGIYGLSKKEAQIRINNIVKKLNLSAILSKKVGKLSGGWQRRVSIAMALLNEPAILFLDEPTLGLDVIARHELWEFINSLKRKMTIILTTHYMEEAEALSDRIGIMKNGKLLALGSVQEILNKSQVNNFEEAFIKIIKEENI